MNDDGWSDEDDEAAAKRGWGMFECFEGNRHPPIEVEALSEPKGGVDLSGSDKGDPAAWEDVYDGLLAGDPLCERAVLFLAKHSPDELRNILDYNIPRTCQVHVKEPRQW